jgi:hypothetical protein
MTDNTTDTGCYCVECLYDDLTVAELENPARIVQYRRVRCLDGEVRVCEITNDCGAVLDYCNIVLDGDDEPEYFPAWKVVAEFAEAMGNPILDGKTLYRIGVVTPAEDANNERLDKEN